MDEPRPAWQIAATLLLVVVSSAAVALYSSTLPTRSCPFSDSSPTCSLVRGNVSYASEQVSVPANGTGFGPITSVTFLGVQFRLWPELVSSSEGYLQGTGFEPSGVDLAFVVFSDNSGFGGIHVPDNATVRTWFAPDGAFGVTWLGSSDYGLDVELFVSDPLVSYYSVNVSLSPFLPNMSRGVQQVMEFHGVQFGFAVAGWASPAGPSLDATADLPNGATVDLSLWAGPLVACSVVGDTPFGVLGGATCLESGAADHSVALLWDGNLKVTLMVRAG